jgi:S-adenosylmethionine:tRNA ribosyltransferase-isomerase
MHISDFDYELPLESIAQHPAAERGESKLLVIHRDDRPFEHRTFADIGGFLNPGDLLVLNDTRVLPARLDVLREGFTGKIEVLLTRPKGAPNIWEALARPARKLDMGTEIVVGDGAARARVVGTGDDGLRVLEFPAGTDVIALMKAHGHIPLPPYITRADEPADRERYQTVFARAEGAVAAPTAGLHFTGPALAGLAARGIEVATITLHVGPGTFRPVMTEDPRLHVIDPEWFEVPAATAAAFQKCRAGGGRVVACGTTVVRTLESAVVPDGSGGWTLEAGAGWADVFIFDPWVFKAVDAMITNFHLPRSTLLMLVSAFGGLERIRRAYRNAIREKYRFYSYGDAMLIDG